MGGEATRNKDDHQERENTKNTMNKVCNNVGILHFVY